MNLALFLLCLGGDTCRSVTLFFACRVPCDAAAVIAWNIDGAHYALRARKQTQTYGERGTGCTRNDPARRTDVVLRAGNHMR